MLAGSLVAAMVTAVANVGVECGLADAARERGPKFWKRGIAGNWEGTHLLWTRQRRQLQRHRGPAQGSRWASWRWVVVVVQVVESRLERCWLEDGGAAGEFSALEELERGPMGRQGTIRQSAP
jgi:hypothetical protein